MSVQELNEYRSIELAKQLEINKAQSRKLLSGLLEQLRAKEVTSVELTKLIPAS